MRLLANNEKFGLFLCGREYWVVRPDFTYECLNERSADYKAAQALQSCEERYGAATFKRDDLARW